jgi:hypothetical protein
LNVYYNILVVSSFMKMSYMCVRCASDPIPMYTYLGNIVADPID